MSEQSSRRSFLAGLVGSATAAAAAVALGASPAAAVGSVRAAGRAFLPQPESGFPNTTVKPGVPIGARTVVMLTAIGKETAAPVTYQLRPASDEFTIWSLDVQTGGQWIAWAVLAP